MDMVRGVNRRLVNLYHRQSSTLLAGSRTIKVVGWRESFSFERDNFVTAFFEVTLILAVIVQIRTDKSLNFDLMKRNIQN